MGPYNRYGLSRANRQSDETPRRRFLLTPTVSLLAVLMLLPLLLIPAIPRHGEGWSRSEAERIVRYLSDDARGGRGSFTPGNREAARFIAAEFEAAGLLPADTARSIIRPFAVTRMTPESLSVVLNGATIPAGDCFISTELAEGSWSLSDSFPARTMGGAFNREIIGEGNGVVLIPRIHEKMFRRYRGFASRPRIYEGEPGHHVMVAILTDTAAARSVSVTFRGRTDAPVLENVVGVIPGDRKDQIVLFSAHYDHIGIVSPAGNDSIANGADDNASGTTVLILLAKHFAAGERPVRTLVFAALAAEEIGGFGARRLLRETRPESVVAMVNLEMLGKVAKSGPGTFWITGYDESSLGLLITARLDGSGFQAFPDPYPEERLFYRSDNAAFARVGVPAHTFSSTQIDVDSVYHTVDDEFDRIDPGHIAEIARGIALGIGGVVGGTQTPSRIPVR